MVVLSVQRGLVVLEEQRVSEEKYELVAVPCLVEELVDLAGGRENRGYPHNSNPRLQRLQPLPV